MSQHIFEQTVNDQTYRVQIGWDKPCQCFYGVVMVWVEDAEEEGGGYFNQFDPVWSNLLFDKQFNLAEIAHECTRLGLVIPDGLLENVARDRMRNAVNEVAYYGTVPSPTPIPPDHGSLDPEP